MGRCGTFLGYLCAENVTQSFNPSLVLDVPPGQLSAVAAMTDFSLFIIGPSFVVTVVEFLQ